MTALTDLRTLVRRDLKDEDSANYRWTDAEVDRAIERAVMEYSEYVPDQQKSTVLTIDSSQDIDISTLTDRIDVLQVEHPVDESPKRFVAFTVWDDVLTFRGGYMGDGENCYIYWGKKHSIATTSTVPTAHMHVIALGAVAYAVSSLAQLVADQANIGGANLDKDYNFWAKKAFEMFYAALIRVQLTNPRPLNNPKRINTSTLTPEQTSYGDAQYG